MKRKQVTRIAIVCMALCTAIGAADAQNPAGAWRCGNTYSDQPCTGGKAVALDDAPSADQVRDAERNTQRTQAAADRMERDRLRREKAAAPLSHIPKPTNAVVPTEAAHPVAKKKKGRNAPDFFTAAGPGSSTKKKKSAKTEAGS
jgi:hypothetical protein